MHLLGSLGRLYMFILLVLLFLGAGFALWQLMDFLHEKMASKKTSVKQSMVKTNGVIEKLGSALSAKVKGGKFDMTNNWLKLAVFSLVGIVISVMVLGFLSSANSQGMQPGAMANMNGVAMNGNMNGGMNMATPVGNMQMAGGMNGYGNMGMNTNANMMMQLNQMQMMVNQMQQQMATMNNMNNMNNMNSSSNMSSGGSMGMMNMGMSGGSNMNSSSSSSGSMGGMM